MKRYSLFGLIGLALMLPALAWASEGGGVNHAFTGSTSNLGSLQRGAKYFVNYCSGCHTLQYLRYKSLSDDLHIPKQQVLNNLIFTHTDFRQHMINAMPKEEAKDWFGKAPPDLSLEARYRGTDWIYSYLLNYYVDADTTTGVNNLTYPNTAMPHPLWELQGWQVPVYSDADEQEHIDHLKLAEKGELSEEEYRQVVSDITAFLAYAGEPGKMTRLSLGYKVIIFLIILTGILYLLKREYWRDIH